MSEQPRWMLKHPCDNCGTGYGECAQFLALSLKCCSGCSHPGRWVVNPYTDEEIAEMQSGRIPGKPTGGEGGEQNGAEEAQGGKDADSRNGATERIPRQQRGESA